MATSSFDKHFILKTPEEVERFYESFNKEPRKLIDRTLTSPEKEREDVEKLKQLLSREASCCLWAIL